MEKSFLLIKKTWLEFFFIVLLYLFALYGIIAYQFILNLSIITIIFILVFTYCLINSIPGSYLLFNEEGITIAKKSIFRPRKILHFDWAQCKKVEFRSSKIRLYCGESVIDIECTDYFGFLIHPNGKTKLFSPSRLDDCLEKIWKDYKIPYSRDLLRI